MIYIVNNLNADCVHYMRLCLHKKHTNSVTPMHESISRKTEAAGPLSTMSADDNPAAIPASEQEITDRIFSAVMEQRLPPGTKLSENILCEAFRASRARIRRALLILAERGVVELRSNRGAFVANPSVDNARHVFAARRAIEPAIVREAVRNITDEQLTRLGAHIEGEAVAQATARHREAIRQSGAFHVRLAEIGGNPVLARMLAELVARTSLIIGLFGASSTSCSEGDHRKLLEAISDRDGNRAAELMVRHLDHIEKDLQLVDVRPARIDVRAVLAS